jgi:hypothetical protein
MRDRKRCLRQRPERAGRVLALRFIAMPGAVSFAVMTGKGKTRLTSVPANPDVKCAARQRRRAIAAETPPAARPGSAAPSDGGLPAGDRERP